jgi:hypothetical protein
MQAGVESLHETMFACVGMVTEIEANADVFYATVRTHARVTLQSSLDFFPFP